MKGTRCGKGLSRGLFWLLSLALLLALVLAANGTLAIQASPGPDSITDSFADEAMIASKVNLVVAGGQVQLGEVFSSALYGGSDRDYFYAVYADSGHVYAAGETFSEGLGWTDALLVSFNIDDLSIASRKVYGGYNHDCFFSVYADGSYVYAAGYAYEGQGHGDALLVQFNIGDLSIASRKVYGGGDFDCFYSVYADGSYVYAAGVTGWEMPGSSDALLVKFDTGDLNIASGKVYGGSDYDYFRSIYADSSHVYAAGETYSEGLGWSDALLVSFNIDDLSIASRKVYGGSIYDRFHSVYADGSYVYAAGETYSEGQGGAGALLVKFDTGDLSIASRKVYGGDQNDAFHSVYADDSHVYTAGETASEGQGGDALLVKFNISDLSIASRKIYGGGDWDCFNSVHANDNYVYAAGETISGGQGEDDAWLVKFDIALAAGTAPDSCGLVCQDSGLNLDDSGLNLDDSNLPLADSGLALADSTLTLNDSALTPATCFSSFPSGTLGSTNLLSGQDVSSIDSFCYNASSVPSGTVLKVQFSQDDTNWCDSSGTPGGWDTCAQGPNSIALFSLGWSGPNFYYKMQFASDGSNTPVLDGISVIYSPTAPPVGGEAYPVNKLAILAPWIAIGIAVAVGSLIVVRRPRAQS